MAPGKVNIELASPYGYLTTETGAVIENGRKGFRTGDGKIKFSNHPSPVKVPEHWLADDALRPSGQEESK